MRLGGRGGLYTYIVKRSKNRLDIFIQKVKIREIGGGVKHKRDIREGYGTVGRLREHIDSKGKNSLGKGSYYGIYHSKHSIDC